MVGREDNDKGYPLRFLPVLRELRHEYPEINLSIHAGEVDEPTSTSRTRCCWRHAHRPWR